jgi:hypothetical protein
MAAVQSQLLPQHDVFPPSPWAARFTFVVMAAACMFIAVRTLPNVLEAAALVAISAVLLVRAWSGRAV